MNRVSKCMRVRVCGDSENVKFKKKGEHERSVHSCLFCVCMCVCTCACAHRKTAQTKRPRVLIYSSRLSLLLLLLVATDWTHPMLHISTELL